MSYMPKEEREKLSKDITERLRSIINIEKTTKTEFSRKNDLNVKILSNMEFKRATPNGITLYKLIKHSKININWLLTGKGCMYLKDKQLRDNNTLFVKIDKDKLKELSDRLLESKKEYVYLDCPLGMKLKGQL